MTRAWVLIGLFLLIVPMSAILAQDDDSLPGEGGATERKLQEDAEKELDKQNIFNLFNPLNPKDRGTQDTVGKSPEVVSFVQGALGDIIKTLFNVLAVISILPIVIGGFQMVAGSKTGKEQKVLQAKQTLFWGVAGLILGLSGLIVFQFILQFFTTQP